MCVSVSVCVRVCVCLCVCVCVCVRECVRAEQMSALRITHFHLNALAAGAILCNYSSMWHPVCRGLQNKINRKSLPSPSPPLASSPSISLSLSLCLLLPLPLCHMQWLPVATGWYTK